MEKQSLNEIEKDPAKNSIEYLPSRKDKKSVSRNRVSKMILSILKSFIFYLLFLILLFLSIFVVRQLGENTTSAGVIANIIFLSILATLLLHGIILIIFRRKRKQKQLNLLFDPLTIIFSFWIGIATTTIGFTISSYITNQLQVLEDTKKLITLLQVYGEQYEEQADDASNRFIYLTGPTTPILDRYELYFGTHDKEKLRSESTLVTFNLIKKKELVGNEPFLDLMKENVDLLYKVSPELQSSITDWKPVEEMYNFKLINSIKMDGTGLPFVATEIGGIKLPSQSKKEQNKNWKAYRELALVTLELEKRHHLLSLETMYLKKSGIESTEKFEQMFSDKQEFYNRVIHEVESIDSLKDFKEFNKSRSELYKKLDKEIEKEQKERVYKMEDGSVIKIGRTRITY
ncbi:hypothetical protein [Peribacillus simplex]|uniref:hypothetical protein n=1 Tax=Peribacillus simplex TaxID=1478 RepID=UPI0011AA5EBF|nr:hypothetical protein [Peribacillus simplex]